MFSTIAVYMKLHQSTSLKYSTEKLTLMHAVVSGQLTRSLLLVLGDRAFSVAGPRAWNSRPRDLRETTSLTVFR